MCCCPLEHHDGRMTSAEAPAVAGGARVAVTPEWPPGGPQTLRQPSRGRVALAALVWLLAGASMSSLNKWIFTVHGFGRPLLLSALHMLAAALACHRGARRPMPGSTRCQILLLSLTFGTSMACGNVGLSTVPLDLAQLATTTTPLFTLALSVLLLGRRHHPLQFAAMGPLCLGAACSLAGELRTPPAGCGFLLVATCLRGLKSVQQSNPHTEAETEQQEQWWRPRKHLKLRQRGILFSPFILLLGLRADPITEGMWLSRET
ncbi:solute carrier family 35 member E4 isoform X2 [Cynocephalus volans]|uniref:solute carrier family 35 member E4 isoform X2 n=2 Tax=Cynocephalus volans TaxID=110931 RepID=UPI002FC88A19